MLSILILPLLAKDVTVLMDFIEIIWDAYPVLLVVLPVEMHKPAIHARYQLEKLQILQEKHQIKDVLALTDITKLGASSVQNVPLNA